MDNEQYNKYITDFHAQLTLRILDSDSENRYRRTIKDVPDMLQQYITSFNSTVAKPFLDQLTSRINHSSQFDMFPEQFRISKDGEEAFKKLVIADAEKINDAIYTSLQTYGSIAKEKDIHPNIIRSQTRNIKTDIEENIDTIATEFNKHLNDSQNYQLARDFMSSFYPLSRNRVEFFKDVISDFDNQLETKLIEKDPEAGAKKAGFFKEIFQDMDRQQKRYQPK